jgi:two-component system chemotaxis response regulator CheB
MPSPAPGRARVLVADDSVVVRGLIARWLEEGGFEVATVPNGLMAISALDRVEPDIVLLDLDMPELDGMAALPRLLEKRPGLSVVVVSTLTQRNADISLKCLSLGAVDYLPKPGSNREVTTSLGFRQELVAKVRELARPRRRVVPEPAAAPAPLPTRSRGLPVLPRCLLIGASTGGPKAIADVLGGLGAAALRSVPTLIVQHMPPIFTKVFAEHLQGLTGLPCREAQDGEAPLPGHVYVAPGGRHMGLSRDRDQRIALRLDAGPPVNFCRPAVDVLFRDAAAVFGASALAVVLTGMGSDGLDGVKALAQTGAAVIAQDEATSVVWGMPGHVARSGLAQEILSLGGIAPAIRALLGGAR